MLQMKYGVFKNFYNKAGHGVLAQKYSNLSFFCFMKKNHNCYIFIYGNFPQLRSLKCKILLKLSCKFGKNEI